MKRKTIIVSFLLAVIAAGALCCLINDRQSIFAGNRVKNPDCYTLRFAEMNQNDSHTLTLHEGDTLSVDFSIERGRADLTIGMPSEKPIYKGDNIESGSFEVTVPADGKYLIKVSAKHASGFILIDARNGKN